MHDQGTNNSTLKTIEACKKQKYTAPIINITEIESKTCGGDQVPRESMAGNDGLFS